MTPLIGAIDGWRNSAAAEKREHGRDKH
jgi:hypothetical protein